MHRSHPRLSRRSALALGLGAALPAIADALGRSVRDATARRGLTAPVLRGAYGVEMCVLAGPDGHPAVLPLRALPRPDRIRPGTGPPTDRP